MIKSVQDDLNTYLRHFLQQPLVQVQRNGALSRTPVLQLNLPRRGSPGGQPNALLMTPKRKDGFFRCD